MRLKKLSSYFSKLPSQQLGGDHRDAVAFQERWNDGIFIGIIAGVATTAFALISIVGEQMRFLPPGSTGLATLAGAAFGLAAGYRIVNRQSYP